jgi:hypothetical protein
MAIGIAAMDLLLNMAGYVPATTVAVMVPLIELAVQARLFMMRSLNDLGLDTYDLGNDGDERVWLRLPNGSRIIFGTPGGVMTAAVADGDEKGSVEQLLDGCLVMAPWRFQLDVHEALAAHLDPDGFKAALNYDYTPLMGRECPPMSFGDDWLFWASAEEKEWYAVPPMAWLDLLRRGTKTGEDARRMVSEGANDGE